MLTKEEKASLERQRCEGKVRCKELYATVEQLERLLKSYRDKHSHWRRRYEEADRKLADEEKKIIVPTGKSGRSTGVKTSEISLNLTQEQIEKMAEVLGVKLDQ